MGIKFVKDLLGTLSFNLQNDLSLQATVIAIFHA
jgi:hypothetical protein